MVLLGGCATPPTPVPTTGPTVGLHVGNGTTLDVTLVVNGVVEGVFPAGGQGPALSPASLPSLPWAVEAKSPSGRVLATMTVSIADGTQTDPTVHRIPMGQVDPSCGRLTLWAGDYPPSGPIPPSPGGSPGDCAP